MSTRHLLSIGMGAVALLLVASVGVVFTSLGDKGTDSSRIDLAVSQQSLVRDLSHQVEALAAAGNLVHVNQARQELGETILKFDQNLTGLLHGGTIITEEGKEIKIPGPKSPTVKSELAQAAELWVQTGLPLADLAAGEFSIFSSAGQDAVAGLSDNNIELKDLFTKTAGSIQAEAQSRQAKGNFARWFSLGFTGIFIMLGIGRFKPSRQIQNQTATQTPLAPMMSNNAPMPQTDGQEQASQAAPTAPQVFNNPPSQKFKSPVDFDNVSASVDQLSVDMNTIANSTNKMQVAIDSVGHAMQGMLFSLNQMAQDTAEGYKIVRGANNAATYTHSTAGELAESALEMSRVVSRVTQLAMKTKQVAGQIEAEAVHTGSTGEAFTSVVAGEVQGLAQQTSQATAGIEQTVAEILGTARHYEEAIGQIIKNISAINKVSENLGELMLHPPAAGVAGTPLPGLPAAPLTPQPVAVQAAAPVAEPVAAPVAEPAAVVEPTPPAAPAPEPVAAPESATPESEPAPEENDDWGAAAEEPSTEEVAEKTSDAIEETASEPTGSGGNVFMLGGGGKKPKPKKPEPEAKTEEPEAAPEKKDDGDSNIFMLNKSTEKAPEPKAEESAPAEEEDDGGANIFMLNKPAKNAAEPKEEKPAEPVVETEPKAEEPAAEEEEEDSGANIFMLNKPAKKAPEPEKETPEAKEEPVTVPADDAEEKKDGGGGNIFMLNKKT